MADSAEGDKQELIIPKIPNLKGSLKSVDSKVYTQLFIFVAIAVVVAGVMYVFLLISQELTVKEQTKVAAPTVQVVDKKSQDIKERSSKDQTRKNDLHTINSGLKSYFVSNEKVPESLNGLVPDTLPELPKDPETKEEYIYSPSEDLKSWKISATLSNKKAFEVSGP